MVNPLCKERFPSLNLSFQRWNRRGNSLLSSEKHRLTGTNLLLTAINRLYSGTCKKMQVCRFCNTFFQWVCRLLQWNALHILLFAMQCACTFLLALFSMQCNVLLCRTLKLQSRTCLHFCKFPMQYTVLSVGSVCVCLTLQCNVCLHFFICNFAWTFAPLNRRATGLSMQAFVLEVLNWFHHP